MNPAGEVHLSVPDLDAARGFSRDLLGFSVVFESDWFLSLDTGCGVHLCCNARREDYLLYGTGGKGLKIELRVTDVDETYARLAGYGVPFAFPPEDKPWGLRSCGVVDPEGYRLWFSTPLEIS